MRHGRAEAAGLDDAQRELRLPLQLPHLVEGAAARTLAGGGRAPRQLEQAQPVQQVAARKVVGLAQVQVERARGGLGLQAQAFLLLLDVALQRHGRHLGRHLAHAVADGQALADQRERRLLAHADHAAHGLVQFGQAGCRAFAQRGERVGQARGLDQVGGGAIEVVFAQEPRHAREPAGAAARHLLALLPEVLVPAGRIDARAVAAGAGEVAVGPRHPGGEHLEPGQALEQRGVGLGGGRALQRRHVPGAADHGDALVAGLDGFAYRLPHEGLAQLLALRGARAAAVFGRFGAHGRHGLGDGAEQVFAVAALLDHVVPPALAVGIAGCMGEPVEGVVGDLRLRRFFTGCGFGGRCFVVFVVAQRLAGFGFGCFLSLGGLGFVGRARGLLDRHAVRLRQVDEAHRQVARHAPLQRLPFGRELGEGIEGREPRVLARVDQHRDRRAQVGMRHEGQQAFGVWRPFDQDAVGLQRLEGAQQAARAAGPVVADAEVVQRRAHFSVRRENEDAGAQSP